MRVAFCYQIPRCADDLRPEGKAQAGTGSLEPKGWGENPLTAAPARLRLLQRRGGAVPRFGQQDPQGRRLPALVCGEAAQAAVSRSARPTPPGQRPQAPTGHIALGRHAVDSPTGALRGLGITLLGHRVLSRPGSHPPPPPTRTWRRTFAGTRIGIAMGPGATLRTLGLRSTTVHFGAAVSPTLPRGPPPASAFEGGLSQRR